MEIVNLRKLGTLYNIVDQEGKQVSSVRIMYQDDILSAALGEFSEVAYLDFDDYLKQSHQRLSGFIEDPLSVYWHTCSEVDYALTEIIDICIENKYTTVIIELLSDDVLDFGPV